MRRGRSPRSPLAPTLDRCFPKEVPELQRLSDEFPTPSSAQAPKFCTSSRKAQLAQSLTGRYSQEVWEMILTERGQTQRGRAR